MQNNDQMFFEKMRERQQKKFVAISEEELKTLPVKQLRLEEFIAIRDYYTGLDFEKTNPLPFSMPVVFATLWFVQKMGQKLKFRWFI